VAPGSYEISPSAPAFVIAETNYPRAKTVVVGEDENVEGINFSLARGGVITGKVVDAEGRPVIQQQVQIFRAEDFEKQSPQQRPLYAYGNAMTDDRGIYRMYGLVPGRYKVASGRSEEVQGVPLMGRTSYRQVFHPDVTEQSKATIIEVGEGGEAKDVDIK